MIKNLSRIRLYPLRPHLKTTTTSTSLMPQFAQAVPHTRHVVIFYFYTNKQKAIKIILK